MQVPSSTLACMIIALWPCFGYSTADARNTRKRAPAIHTLYHHDIMSPPYELTQHGNKHPYFDPIPPNKSPWTTAPTHQTSDHPASIKQAHNTLTKRYESMGDKTWTGERTYVKSTKHPFEQYHRRDQRPKHLMIRGELTLVTEDHPHPSQHILKCSAVNEIEREMCPAYKQVSKTSHLSYPYPRATHTRGRAGRASSRISKRNKAIHVDNNTR